MTLNDTDQCNPTASIGVAYPIGLINIRKTDYSCPFKQTFNDTNYCNPTCPTN